MVEINSFHISSEQAIREDHMAVIRSFEVKKSHERYHMTKDDGQSGRQWQRPRGQISQCCVCNKWLDLVLSTADLDLPVPTFPLDRSLPRVPSVSSVLVETLASMPHVQRRRRDNASISTNSSSKGPSTSITTSPSTSSGSSMGYLCYNNGYFHLLLLPNLRSSNVEVINNSGPWDNRVRETGYDKLLLMHPNSYLTHDLELAAIAFALRIWRYYLYGVSFQFFTNHNSLKFIFIQKDLNNRQQRWLELLADYSIEIAYHLMWLQMH